MAIVLSLYSVAVVLLVVTHLLLHVESRKVGCRVLHVYPWGAAALSAVVLDFNGTGLFTYCSYPFTLTVQKPGVL